MNCDWLPAYRCYPAMDIVTHRVGKKRQDMKDNANGQTAQASLSAPVARTCAAYYGFENLVLPTTPTQQQASGPSVAAIQDARWGPLHSIARTASNLALPAERRKSSASNDQRFRYRRAAANSPNKMQVEAMGPIGHVHTCTFVTLPRKNGGGAWQRKDMGGGRKVAWPGRRLDATFPVPSLLLLLLLHLISHFLLPSFSLRGNGGILGNGSPAPFHVHRLDSS